MNIDKRYVELLAGVASGKRNRWWGRLAYISYFFFIIGVMLIFDRVASGYFLAAAGLFLMGFSIIRKNKDERKNREEFTAYYNKNGCFPPWPEDVK